MRLLLACLLLTACAREGDSTGPKNTDYVVTGTSSGMETSSTPEISTDRYTEIAALMSEYPELKDDVMRAMEDAAITALEYYQIMDHKSKIDLERAKRRLKNSAN